MNDTWESSLVSNKIGINFKHDQTLRLALIHPSYAKQLNDPEINNQRLEFLGTSVLKIIVVDYLVRNFSYFSLAKIKALKDKITAPDRQTQLWYDLQLGDAYPFLALKEERYRLKVKEQNPFEEAFRALVGAIYIDRGFSQARNWVQKHLISPLLQKYLKPEVEFSPTDKQLQYLGEILLEVIINDYLYHQILQTQPQKLKVLARKLTAKDAQTQYLSKLFRDHQKSESLAQLLSQLYLQLEEENSKSSLRQISNSFRDHCLDDDEIMALAIALLLKDGFAQKWIIHHMMGYPSNKYNEGREKFYKLTGQTPLL